MNWARCLLLAGPLLALPAAGHALTQVAGPVQIGPSSAEGNDPDHSASLSTTLVNRGAVADRLVNVACPGVGSVALADGQVQPVAPGTLRNGLDLPGAAGGRGTRVQARFMLSNAREPMIRGALIPCALSFQHAGQRIVIFAVGAHETDVNEP